MPLQIICHGCGAIIYEGPIPLNLDEIYYRFKDGKCPKCRRILSTYPMLSEVRDRRFTEEEIRSLLKGR